MNVLLIVIGLCMVAAALGYAWGCSDTEREMREKYRL